MSAVCARSSWSCASDLARMPSKRFRSWISVFLAGSDAPWPHFYPMQTAAAAPASCVAHAGGEAASACSIFTPMSSSSLSQQMKVVFHRGLGREQEVHVLCLFFEFLLHGYRARAHFHCSKGMLLTPRVLCESGVLTVRFEA